MVDWMVEVFSIFTSMDATYFLAVYLMDMYTWKSIKDLKNEDVHLIGVTCMYMASKFQEVEYIRLSKFVKQVSHNSFTAEEIKKKESEIIEVITPECLIITSIYDFVVTYFFDFYENNKELLQTENDKKVFQYLKETSIYLSKICLHYDAFYQELSSLNAVSCIVCGIKLIQKYANDIFSNNAKSSFNEWIQFLWNRGGFEKKKIETISSKIYSAYSHYQKSKSISRNLNKFKPLKYIKNQK